MNVKPVLICDQRPIDKVADNVLLIPFVQLGRNTVSKRFLNYAFIKTVINNLDLNKKLFLVKVFYDCAIFHTF